MTLHAKFNASKRVFVAQASPEDLVLMRRTNRNLQTSGIQRLPYQP